MARVVALLLTTAVIALPVNFLAGVDGRCSDQGWSGCGWISMLSAWLVVGCIAGVIGVLLAMLVRYVRR